MPSQRTDQQLSAEEIAQPAVCAWRGLAERLSPIIGERGFQVLLVRSMHLTRADFPFLLLPPPESDDLESLFATLKQSLEHHPALAAGADRALLLTFTGLLNSLIGKVLTARLIDGASEASPDGRSQESNNDG